MTINNPKFFEKESNLPESAKRVDILQECLEELFFVENQQWKKGMPETDESLAEFLKNKSCLGVWVYYPWNNTAMHIVDEDLYFKLRTARNHNLITIEEQDQYRKTKVGIVGLSVGSGIVSALVISGGPKTLKIADFDVIEVGNLNRIKARLEDVGSSKVEVAARQVWELDPFANVHIWDKGVTKKNLRDFIVGEPRLDVFIDEMDSLNLKFLARVICRECNLPVLMATDDGDTVIFDIERFDLEPNRQLFHGLCGDLSDEDFKDMNREKWLRLSTKIIGPDFMTPELQNSILQIGKTLAGVPQLGTTASVAGAVASLVVRRIANNQDMPSGRYVISLEETLVSGWNSIDNKNDRKQKTKDFKSKLFSKGE